MGISKVLNRWQKIGNVFLWLLKRDVLVVLPRLPSRILSVIVWTILFLYLYEYVGIAGITGCGLFMAASESGSRAFRRVFPALRIAGDLLNERALYYYLTLPIPQSLVFLALALSSSLELMAMYVWVFPIAKLVLGSAFTISWVGCLKAAAVFVCAHIFYGMSALLLATGNIAAVDELAIIHSRYIEPLFWIGGYYFTWHLLYAKHAWWAYLLLLNPIIYACEGMRAALCPDILSLPVGGCCAALVFFSVVIGCFAIRRMKKKVDGI